MSHFRLLEDAVASLLDCFFGTALACRLTYVMSTHASSSFRPVAGPLPGIGHSPLPPSGSPHPIQIRSAPLACGVILMVSAEYPHATKVPSPGNEKFALHPIAFPFPWLSLTSNLTSAPFTIPTMGFLVTGFGNSKCPLSWSLSMDWSWVVSGGVPILLRTCFPMSCILCPSMIEKPVFLPW